MDVPAPKHAPTLDDLVLVAGGGGFIGGHLVADLLARGHTNIRAVDIQPLDQWQQRFDGVDNRRLDLAEQMACREVVDGAAWVFDLAADMGGMGFIENNKARCMLSVLIGTHLLLAAKEAEVDRFFFASSACVYAAEKQDSPDVVGLREQDVYPAMPEDGYGWEKLFMERLCHNFLEDFGVATRVARYHNVYGPQGTFEGGREKAPAAISRKVAEAVLSGDHTIEVWGDGRQTRSFTYIDDCLIGTRLVAGGDESEPVNVGSSELVTVDELVGLVESIAGVALERRYLTDAPQGVRGRNSDNTLVQERYGWEPSTKLVDGLEATYRWVYDQLAARR